MFSVWAASHETWRSTPGEKSVFIPASTASEERATRMLYTNNPILSLPIRLGRQLVPLFTSSGKVWGKLTRWRTGAIGIYPP